MDIIDNTTTTEKKKEKRKKEKKEKKKKKGGGGGGGGGEGVGEEEWESRGMDHLLGLLKVRVIRGTNLAFRDARGSDPYVVLRMGRQRLKTSVKKKTVNPEWNEDLTLSVSDPVLPLKIEIYDKDTFSRDDKMGKTELDIQPFLDAVKLAWDGIPEGALLKSVEPSRDNCVATESYILYKGRKVVQDVILRLKHVESGEIELQLHWVTVPGGLGFN
ncbi:GTPase activating protein 1-like [Iris pallida]|uniref:GTPase activating protein 1-like n=1 Tax=Iris pallida TaxID=29817 RepID=A0AAX6HZG5_IRIPA|nr:GTPase activating protein 1-like [Iris pallida]